MKKLQRRARMLSGLAGIRQKLGYTQEEFAQLLRVPRSTLSMAESRRRLLPFNALVKLGELEIELLEQQKKQEPPAEHS